MEFVADFETTSVRVYETVKRTKRDADGHLVHVQEKRLDQVNSKAFVCAWAIIPVEADPDPAHIQRGRTIQSFLAYCENLYLENKKTKRKGRKAAKLNIMTHNLKFDGDFILYEILKTGSAEVTNEVRENVLYNFTIKFKQSGAEITFYDSYKIFPMKAEKIGTLYGIPKLLGEWDYNKYRDESTDITAEEWSYVDHDVMIISRALADYRARGYMENTQASIAYNERLRRTFPWFNKMAALRFKKSDYERFISKFPHEIRPLPFKMHSHLLLAYFGGISWLNPKYACQDLYNAHSYDVHSMYPDKMRNYPLPCDFPEIIFDNPSPKEAHRILMNRPCVIADIENLSITLKSPEHFPFLMFRTNPRTSVRMQGKVISCRNESVCLSCWDYRIMQSEYNIHEMKITKLYCFRSVTGMYADFIDYFYSSKQEADKVLNSDTATPDEKLNASILRNVAKVMQNASYGKDGTKLGRMANKTVFNREKGILENELHADVAQPEYYLPSAIFITAHARYQLFKAAILVRKDFIYSDTDSVKVTNEGNEILKNSPDFDVDPYRLGAWGYEGCYTTARFVRQKTYSYEQINKKGILERHYTVCGAPDSIKLSMRIDDFKPGMVISLDQIHAEGREGKLLPVRVPGGVILEETGFQIAKHDNWDEAQGRNMPINYDLFCDIIKKKNAEWEEKHG